MDVSRQDLLLARCRIAGFDVILAIHALCERAAYSDLMLADQKRLMDDVRGIPRERWIEDVVLSSAPDSTAPTR